MITATLAAWVPTLTFEVLPARARSRAKLAIFDACGTALAGTHHPAVQHLRQLIVEMGSAPQARIIGDRLRTSPLDAAWVRRLEVGVISAPILCPYIVVCWMR